jgi:hypothetical protein
MKLASDEAHENRTELFPHCTAVSPSFATGGVRTDSRASLFGRASSIRQQLQYRPGGYTNHRSQLPFRLGI